MPPGHKYLGGGLMPDDPQDEKCGKMPTFAMGEWALLELTDALLFFRRKYILFSLFQSDVV